MATKNVVTVVIAGENQTQAAFRALQNEFAGVERNMGGLQGAMQKLQSVAGALGLGAAALELGRLGKAALESAVNIGHLSQKTGISTQVLSDLGHAAKMTGDVDMESLAKGLKKLATQMANAAAGGAEAQGLFRSVGVSATDASGQLRPMDQVLFDLAAKFKEMPDGAGKSALAVKLFGRAGTDLIPILNQGSDGLAALFEEAKRLGVELDSNTAAAATAFDEDLKRLQATMDGLALAMVQSLLPALQQVTQNIKDNSMSSEDVRGKADALAISFKTLVTVVAVLQAMFRALGTSIRDVAAQEILLAKLDFKGVLALWKMHLHGVGDEARDTAEGLRELWAAANKLSTVPTFGHGLIGPPPKPGGSPPDADSGAAAGAAVETMVNDLRGADLRTPTELLKEVADAMHLIELAANTSNPELSKFIATLAHPLPTGWPDELKDMEQQIDLIFRKLANDSAAVQQEVAQGATSQIQGEQKIVDLSRAAGDELAKLLPRFRELAALTGDPRMALGVEELAVKVRGLQHEADVLGQKMRETFIDSFSNEVAGIVTGTQSIGDAFKNMARAVIAELAKIIARMLIIYILSKLLGGLFGGGGTGVSDLSSIGGSTPMSDFGLPGHALGGSFTAGQPFIAGENGVPELIVPQASGTVIPGSQLQSALGSGGGGNTTYIDARGADIGVEQRLRALETSQPQTVNASVTAMAEMNRRSSA